MRTLLACSLLLSAACHPGSPHSGTGTHGPRGEARSDLTQAGANTKADANTTATSVEEAALAKVTAIHGAPGPWAVLGYRMGEAALAQLGLPRGSFDLLVVHHTPEKVQYSCIADGASAATGASAGKLSLKLEPASETAVYTEYTHRKTGQRVALRPTQAFRDRFANADRARAHELGLKVLQLPEAELFELAP